MNIITGENRDGIVSVAKTLQTAGSIFVAQLCVCAVLFQRTAAERPEWLCDGTGALHGV